MLKKNSGFTMIELLAAIVVLGIMMAVATPAVMTLLRDNKNQTYVDDSIRFGTLMKSKLNSDNRVPVPAQNECIAISLAYLDDNTFGSAPYEGEYDKDLSFVIAKRENLYSDNTKDEYKMFVRLVEMMPNNAYRGIDFEDTNQLYSRDAKSTKVTNFAPDLRNKGLSTFTEASLKSYISSYSGKGLTCSRIIIYMAYTRS